MGTTQRSTVESFRHHHADEINRMVGVTGWVPAQNVTPLLNDVDSAEVQYWADDGAEAFVITE
jgi:hypothetical protein